MGIEPFGEFNIPVFTGVEKAVDAFVKEERSAKIFGILGEVIGIFHGEFHKVATDNLCLKVCTNEVSAFQGAAVGAGSR